MQKVIYFSTLLLSCLLTGKSFANCPQVIGRAQQSLNSPGSWSREAVTRVIYKLRMNDGSIQYHYSMTYLAPSNEGAGFSQHPTAEIEMNGEKTNFNLVYDNDGGRPDSVTFADLSCGYTASFPGKNLFIYARNGAHLNAWDITIHLPDDPEEHYHFPQTDLSQLGL